ncbi:MAG TPA: CheR family methyltransferase, partial [Anaerolineae bacterium]|nr:CheR family methyltransferase [Anaerolineae bacterium]
VEQWAITILGTDINTEALNRARQATYGEWAFRETRARQWRSRYFRPMMTNRYELIPAVREMVTFARLNLAEPAYPAYETNTTMLDLILCRNVTIYFDKAVTTQAVERFYHSLAEGGWLVAGHAEYSLETYRHFQTRTYADAILYQRDGQAAPAPLTPARMAPPVVIAEPPWLSGIPSLSPPSPPVTEVPKPPTAPLPAVELDPVEHAQELMEYGHTEQACEILLAYVRQQPNHVQACTLLGQVYANLGAWTEAEEWCRRATQSNILALNAHYTLALVLQHQQKLDQAIASMRKVIYLDHLNVLGHYGLANLYYASGQRPQAHKSLDNARRLLEGRAAEEMIPESGGVTVGRLREAITRQQQQWSAAPLANKRS